MKVCCCEAAPFGNHCEPCERGGHAACTNPTEMEVEPAQDVAEEIERAASRPQAKLFHGSDALEFISRQGLPPMPGDEIDYPPQSHGVWTAFHYDMSEVILFEGEVDALRYAVRNGMQVELIPYGVGIRGHVNRKEKE
jgi:hypothetical protein